MLQKNLVRYSVKVIIPEFMHFYTIGTKKIFYCILCIYVCGVCACVLTCIGICGGLRLTSGVILVALHLIY